MKKIFFSFVLLLSLLASFYLCPKVYAISDQAASPYQKENDEIMKDYGSIGPIADSDIAKPFYERKEYWANTSSYFALFFILALLSPLWLLFAILMLLQKFDTEKYEKIGLYGEVMLAAITFLLLFVPYFADPSLSLWDIIRDPGLAGFHLAIFALLVLQVFYYINQLRIYKKITGRKLTGKEPVKNTGQFLGTSR